MGQVRKPLLASKINGEIDNITYKGHRKVDLGY